MDARAQAADEVIAVQWHYASRGRSLAAAALAGAQRFVEWSHHPREDHVDAASGARFYYHAHPAGERAEGEHGHFHLFVPTPGQPDAISHLVGISLDARGLPLRLFTTNQWVTGEAWRDAPRMEALIAGFSLRAHGRLAPVARWLTAMVRLYDAEIIQLLHERDRRVGGRGAALQDRSLHITSQRAVSLPDRLGRMQALRISPEENDHVPSH
ncbi:hypothetical protein JJB11_03775 [Ramlibacter ginsenosidimutans]|uniref:DUF6969 domain-containing protein n=1 Tax=Ramlibacter ginsenosidimutans TaxID=502333 RepID=A0A934TPK7_9BURK|nr:hypothetical protein [Ramlibacter ginsenosidimutans]MBK6005201.1 hypothetical protein [Ramlibacter ginsenosidimutans]